MLLLIILIILLVVLAGLLVTQQTKNQKKLSQNADLHIQKSMYETITQRANDIIVVIDIANGQIHQANDKASEMLGYTPERLLKLTIFDLHPADLLQRSSEIVADVWEQKGLVYRDIPFVTASGEQIPVECSAKVLEFVNRPAIVIYARDLRERLKLEQKIMAQSEEISRKNKSILDSIQYAKRLQTAILPPENQIKQLLPQSFVIYMPKDIISGDFYWIEKHQNYVFAAVADCTGHGVPGSLLSIMGNSGLHRAVFEFGLIQTSDVLDKLNELFFKTLRQDQTDVRDGMDIALVRLDLTSKEVQFSGAYNPAYIIRSNQLITDNIEIKDKNETHVIIELSPNRQPIGSQQAKEQFHNTNIQLIEGDTLYLFSDGFADQVGGDKKRKFLTSSFRQMLLSVQNSNMQEQKEKITDIFFQWQGIHEQVDDICVVGFQI